MKSGTKMITDNFFMLFFHWPNLFSFLHDHVAINVAEGISKLWSNEEVEHFSIEFSIFEPFKSNTKYVTESAQLDNL